MASHDPRLNRGAGFSPSGAHAGRSAVLAACPAGARVRSRVGDGKMGRLPVSSMIINASSFPSRGSLSSHGNPAVPYHSGNEKDVSRETKYEIIQQYRQHHGSHHVRFSISHETPALPDCGSGPSGHLDAGGPVRPSLLMSGDRCAGEPGSGWSMRPPMLRAHERDEWRLGRKSSRDPMQRERSGATQEAAALRRLIGDGGDGDAGCSGRDAVATAPAVRRGERSICDLAAKRHATPCNVRVSWYDQRSEPPDQPAVL
jgi:hypothetical protein